jgi:cobalamin biosynthesis protein CbiG
MSHVQDRSSEPPGAAAQARRLCVGVGSTHGAPPDAFARSAEAMLKAAGLAPDAVGTVATSRRKRDEPALRRWAESIGAHFVTFDDATLSAQPAPTRSAQVHAKIGIASVAEAAALAASGGTVLLLTRRTAVLPGGHHHTLAVAQVP